MSTFMVAVDGSKHSSEAFETACRLLNKQEDALLIVICAERSQAHRLLNLGHKEKEAIDDDATSKRLERAQKAILEPFRQLAEERGIKASCIMLKGYHAGHMLCSLVEERYVDFLVVGRCAPKPCPFPLQRLTRTTAQSWDEQSERPPSRKHQQVSDGACSLQRGGGEGLFPARAA